MNPMIPLAVEQVILAELVPGVKVRATVKRIYPRHCDAILAEGHGAYKRGERVTFNRRDVEEFKVPVIPPVTGDVV